MAPDNGGVEVPILSWFDRPVKQAIWSVFNDLNNYTEALDIFNRYRRNHFKRLKENIQYIKILGMNRPILLTDVYSPAMVSTTIRSRLYEQTWLRVSESVQTSPVRRRPVGRLTRADKFIEDNARVTVLGPAGSGKTTLLRHLALSMCDKEVFSATGLRTSRFPFFVYLPSYARETEGQQPLVDYLANELVTYTNNYAPNFVRRLLEKGLAIVMLDSLDEVQPTLREAVVEQVREFSSGFPRSRIVVSCRTADYDSISESFYEVELERLTEEAVRTTVSAWFRQEPEKSDRLLGVLERDDSILSLCATPLLLSLLCIQFGHDLALPKQRTELFRRCVDAFLREWDAGRGFRRDTAYSSLSDHRKEKIFETVAGACLNRYVRYAIPTEEVISCIQRCCDSFGMNVDEAEGILKEIEAHHGILERFSIDSYMFSHPSLQEYFAAHGLLSQRREMKAVEKHCENRQWAGVIESVAAMHGNPISILEFLAKRSNLTAVKDFRTMARRTSTLVLLYRCVAFGVSIENRRREELYKHIVSAYRHMATILRDSGVFPISVLERKGVVRHTYFYYRRRRTRTLGVALEPLRRLGKSILLVPSDLYAEKVLERVKDISYGGDLQDQLAGIAEALFLVLPIVGVRREEVRGVLEGLKGEDVFGVVRPLVEESLEVLDAEYGL